MEKKKMFQTTNQICFEHILRMRILCIHFYGFVRPFPPMIKESAVVSTLSSPSAAKLRLAGKMPQELRLTWSDVGAGNLTGHLHLPFHGP
jgi:hypothetical protein